MALTPDQLPAVVLWFRYVYGSSAGAAYALRRPAGSSIAVVGTAFGLLLWLMSDGAILPAIRARNGGDPHTDSRTAISILYHVVFGVTTGLVQRSLEDVSIGPLTRAHEVS